MDKNSFKSDKNYITPQGMETLRTELKELLTKERPKVVETVSWAAGNGDRSENGDYIYGKRRLREIDRRIRFLTRRLESMEIINPALIEADQVLFGATVTVMDEENQKKIYQIVGVDEADAKSGKVSWRSPLGRSLLKRKCGDIVTVSAPKREFDLEILKIEYK